MVKRRRKVNEKVNPFKKLQKPGKHVKRIVIGAAGLVIIAGLAGDATYQIQEQKVRLQTIFHMFLSLHEDLPPHQIPHHLQHVPVYPVGN